MTSSEKKQVYVVLVTVLVFLLLWKEVGFLQSLATTLVIYAIYYSYTALRNKEARKRSLLIALPLFLIAALVMPTSNTDKNVTADTNNSKNAGISENAESRVQQPIEESIKSTPLYKVTSVIDGDTIKVEIDGKTETIRFIGIDTPETKDPNKPVQCYGKQASSRMQHYTQSKMIHLEADDSQGDKDKYDRLLRYVYTEDGKNVNEAMVAEGFAHEYSYDKPYRYQSDFKEAESKAKLEKNGFWAKETCGGDTEQTDPAIVKAQKQKASKAAVLKKQKEAAAEKEADKRVSGSNSRPAPAQSSTYFQNCTAARAAGAAPVYRGDSGYGTHLDRDGDGVGCE